MSVPNSPLILKLLGSRDLSDDLNAVTYLESALTMHVIIAGGMAHPGEVGKTAAAPWNLKPSPYPGVQMTSPCSASVRTAPCTGSTGMVVPGQAGSVSAVPSQVSPPLFPGQQEELTSSVLAPMVRCTINTTMEHGQLAGRIWVEFSFLLRL